jgi:SAM-dependent methyltransferase
MQTKSNPASQGARGRNAMGRPPSFLFKALNALRKLRAVLLNLFCDFLLHWGTKIGISPNFRGRMFWKAGRRDIVPLSELYKFLSQVKPDGQYYPTAPMWSWRSQTVVDMLAPFITKEYSILEIGCNLGRNLNHLWQAGYTQLHGMEISEHAVKRLRLLYPSLSKITIDIGPAEVSIQKLCDDSIDVVFTMATLEQLHPDSRYLFKEIARVARKYVLAIEPREGHRSHSQYPWDIKAEFSEAGLEFIESKPWSALWSSELTQEHEWADDMHPFEAFLFRVNKAGA